MPKPTTSTCAKCGQEKDDCKFVYDNRRNATTDGEWWCDACLKSSSEVEIRSVQFLRELSRHHADWEDDPACIACGWAADEIERLSSREVTPTTIEGVADLHGTVREQQETIERLQGIVDMMPKLVELAAIDAIRNFIQHGHEMSERDCYPNLYRRGDKWRYHRRVAANEWADEADPIEAAEKARRA